MSELTGVHRLGFSLAAASTAAIVTVCLLSAPHLPDRTLTLWYVAFPVTLAASYSLAGWLAVYASSIGGGHNPTVDQMWLIQTALLVFVYAPLSFISAEITAQRHSAGAATVRKHPAGLRPQGHQHRTGGRAGSRRFVTVHGIVDRTRTAHRTATARVPRTARSTPRNAGKAWPARNELSHG